MSILSALHKAFNNLPGKPQKEVVMADQAKKPENEEEKIEVEEKVEEATEEKAEPAEAPMEEAPKEEPKEEAKEEKVEEIVEEKVEEKPAALKESEAVSKLMAQQELLLKQNEELQAKIEALAKEKALVDSQKKLDEAMAEGWLTPAMMKEDADGAESVFVTIAQNYPELFDRFKLVMAPKVLKKVSLTEDSNPIGEAMTDDEAKFEMISKYAADNKIPYIDAARKFGGK